MFRRIVVVFVTVVTLTPAIATGQGATGTIAGVVRGHHFVQQAEAYLIQPLIQQYAVELPAVLLLFSLLAFGVLFGSIGIVLAAPLAVVTYVLVKRLYVIDTLDTPTPIPGEGKD
jgi:predicted PurR-regulated permease PerM